MKVIRIGIGILVVFSVFAFAAVEPWAQALLEIGAAVLLVFWASLYATGNAADFYWNPLGWPLLGFAAIVLLQYFARLTIYPHATKTDLLLLAAYLFVFFAAGQAFRTAAQRVAWAWFVLALGFTVSLFGILQHFTFNGRLYWLRQMQFGGYPFGPFTNRDHFAGFAELVIPMGLALLTLRGTRRDQVPLVGLLTIVPIGAVFLAASRGGIIAIVVEIVLLALFLRKRPLSLARVIAVVAILLVAGAFVAWLGIGTAMERFATLKSGAVTEQRRWIMIRDSWQIVRAHPWVGSGLGTLETAYPKYASYYDGLVVNHAHNDYIEALAETGWLGGVCCAVFLFWLFRRSLARVGSDPDSVKRAVRIGALVACAGLLVHELLDFNLHIPSNALLFFLQAQLASSNSMATAHLSE